MENNSKSTLESTLGSTPESTPIFLRALLKAPSGALLEVSPFGLSGKSCDPVRLLERGLRGCGPK